MLANSMVVYGENRYTCAAGGLVEIRRCWRSRQGFGGAMLAVSALFAALIAAATGTSTVRWSDALAT